MLNLKFRDVPVFPKQVLCRIRAGMDEVSIAHSWWVKDVQLSQFDVPQKVQGTAMRFLSLLRFPQECPMLFKQTF